MVLAEAIQRIRLGKDWRWIKEGARNGDYLKKYEDYREIVAMFADDESAPFSIHRIALSGEASSATDGGFSRPVGTWFGPNTVAHVIR